MEDRTDPRLLRSREAMVAAATALLTEGGLEAQLIYRLNVLAERWDDEQAGAVLAAVLGGSRHDEGMRHLRESLLNQIADALRPAVTAAVERGQLRPDVTPETFAMATAGPLFFERFFAGNHLGRDTVNAVVDAALRGWS